MFLSTKLLPRSDGEVVGRVDEEEGKDGSRNHVEAVERFNDSVDELCTWYQGAAEDVLGKLMSSGSSTR